jgi:hypothetical protein
LQGKWEFMVAKMRAMFELFAGELPPGIAMVNFRRVPANGGTVIELEPTNPAAACFRVHCDEFEAYSVSFGKWSQWEFPYERRYRNGKKDTFAEWRRWPEQLSRAGANIGGAGSH